MPDVFSITADQATSVTEPSTTDPGYMLPPNAANNGCFMRGVRNTDHPVADDCKTLLCSFLQAFAPLPVMS